MRAHLETEVIALKEIKTRQSRESAKGKSGESTLSRRMKEEFRHAGVSQLRHDGEDQQSPTSYAEDKAEHAADRIVSETGSGAVRAVESGRQLFVDHLRKQKTSSTSDRPDAYPVTDPTPEPSPTTVSPVHLEPSYLQPSAKNSEQAFPATPPARDFKSRDGGIEERSPTIKTADFRADRPQSDPIAVGREYVKQAVLEQEMTGHRIPHGGEVLDTTAPVAELPVQSKLKLRFEEETNTPQFKTKNYVNIGGEHSDQVRHQQAAAKQYAREETIRKGQRKDVLQTKQRARDTVTPSSPSAGVSSAPKSAIQAAQVSSSQATVKSELNQVSQCSVDTVPKYGALLSKAQIQNAATGIPELPTADNAVDGILPPEVTKGKNGIPGKINQDKAFTKAGKELKTAGNTGKAAFKTVNPARVSREMVDSFSKAMESLKHSEQMKIAAQKAIVAAKKAAEYTAKAAKAVAKAMQELISALAAGGGMVLILIVVMIVLCFAGMMFASDEDDLEILPVSDEVKDYEPIIQKYAKEHGIPDYVLLIEAVMMQESGGRGNDPMQCSECNFNTQYPHTPGAITAPEYSINVGIQNLADCLRIAQCESPVDMDAIKLALQGYNYGQGYITWAMNKYGEYSKANAIEFSLKTAEQCGWDSYGDMDYVPHVLRYYPMGQIFYDPDTANLIVEVAASQIGNVGGEPYWRWYGFTEHVEWCACFVSWCANQCGYLDTVIPKYAGCTMGVQWFRAKNQWADRSITPEPGMIIFFDWDGNGVSDHTGIVEKSENGYVHTIEGNTTDSCRRRQYRIGSSSIYGYGMPNY